MISNYSTKFYKTVTKIAFLDYLFFTFL